MATKKTTRTSNPVVCEFCTLEFEDEAAFHAHTCIGEAEPTDEAREEDDPSGDYLSQLDEPTVEELEAIEDEDEHEAARQENDAKAAKAKAARRASKVKSSKQPAKPSKSEPKAEQNVPGAKELATLLKLDPRTVRQHLRKLGKPGMNEETKRYEFKGRLLQDTAKKVAKSIDEEARAKAAQKSK